MVWKALSSFCLYRPGVRFIPDYLRSGILTLDFVVEMAFDNSLPRGDSHAALPQSGIELADDAWNHALRHDAVEDKLAERPAHTLFARHSVTLWDEVTPEPCAQPERASDEPER
jgi:hypothetical protein